MADQERGARPARRVLTNAHPDQRPPTPRAAATATSSGATAAPSAWPSAGASVLGSLDRRGHAAEVLAGLEDLAPGFAELTIAGALGGVVGRPGLDLARREVATIAALCSLGREPQLAVHLDYALTLGVTRHELAEVLVQMAVYAGWPSAVSGLQVLREVLADRVDARYDLGDLKVTVISDGYAEMPLATFAAGLGAEQAIAFEREHGPLGGTVPVPLNCVVIERDGMLVVVDPGSGPHDAPSSHGLVPPTEGHFLRSFAAAGFDAERVDLVVLTHGHHDHAGSLALPGDAFPFPRAQVAISEVEYAHWRDHGDFGEARVPDAVASGCREVGKAFTSAISDRIVWLADGEMIAPDMRAISAPGHTPGHMALHVHGTRHDLLLGGDFAGHEVLSLAYPSSHHAADYDGVQAVATRQRLLRDAVDEGDLVHGFHFGTPGIGRVEAAGHGWRYQSLDADRAGTLG